MLLLIIDFEQTCQIRYKNRLLLGKKKGLIKIYPGMSFLIGKSDVLRLSLSFLICNFKYVNRIQYLEKKASKLNLKLLTNHFSNFDYVQILNR